MTRLLLSERKRLARNYALSHGYILRGHHVYVAAEEAPRGLGLIASGWGEFYDIHKDAIENDLIARSTGDESCDPTST